jgi:polyhydroxyalkanoate synthesis regulator phasin
MAVDRGLLDRIKTRGEEVLTQLSAELMSSPRFVGAVEGALRGRDKLEQAASRALRQMHVATQGELRRAGSRIEALEREVAQLRRQLRARPGRAKAAPGRKASATKGRARPKAGASGPGKPGGRVR